MKKMCFILPILFAFLMMGCSTQNTPEKATEEQTTEVETSEMETTKTSTEASTENSFSEEDIVEVDFKSENLVDTTGDTLTEGESEEQSYVFQCSEPAPSKEIIDHYGYVDGYSVLSFDIVSQTVEEYEGYYAVEAVYSQPIEVPGNLAIGEQITLVFNELTGDERTIERREDGLYQLEDEENEPYYPTYFQYWTQEDDEPVVLYDENTDRVDKPVFDGKLYIRKDATIEYAIEHNIKEVTKENLNREYLWFNGVYFDENGYVTRLVYYGD